MHSHKQIRILPEAQHAPHPGVAVAATPVNNRRANEHTAAMPLMLPLIVGGVLLLGVVLMVAVRGREAVPPPAPFAAVATAAPPATVLSVRETIIVTATPVPSPACVSGQSQLAIIEALAQRGEWREAADTAETTLTTSDLCPADRPLLTHKALTNGLKALYTEPVELEPYNRDHQQEQVDRWLRYTERARLAGVNFPSPLIVAREATTTSHHRLAVAAVEVALADREFNPALDRDITKLYISALYGVCYWQIKDPAHSEIYTEGLSYCVASQHLAVVFKTGQGEAAMLLRQLLSDGETAWPSPYPSPLLSRTP
jgi:hypothetical protein